MQINEVFSIDAFKKVANNPSASTSQMDDVTPVVTDPPKRKRGRPKKSEQEKAESQSSDTSANNNNQNMLLCQSNDPYENSYGETNFLLRQTIGQINSLSKDVQDEIDNIRKSKTIKSKYKYISDLCATAGTLIGTKISAIREMNSSTTKCHELEIKRLKDVKAAQSQQDDDKYIADLYSAYVNTPIGMGPSPIVRQYNATNTITNQDVMMSGTTINMDDSGYENYMSNLSPEQNRMILDGNPNIKTIVVYDQVTGDKYFDVIDTTTGTSVPNYPRPDRLILDDTVIDFSNGIASNTNIGQNWEVMVVANPENYA